MQTDKDEGACVDDKNRGDYCAVSWDCKNLHQFQRVSSMSTSEKLNVCYSSYGRMFCRMTCGWCDASTLSMMFTTAKRKNNI